MLIRKAMATSWLGGGVGSKNKEKLLDQTMATMWPDSGLTGSLALIITCHWYGNFYIKKCVVETFSDIFLLEKKKKKREREKETAHIAQIMPCSSPSCKLGAWLSTGFTLCFTHETNGCSRECQWLLQPWGWRDQWPVAVEGNSDGKACVWF